MKVIKRRPQRILSYKDMDYIAQPVTDNDIKLCEEIGDDTVTELEKSWVDNESD